MKIIRISKEDTDHYANNYLTVDARHIMSVAGQSEDLEAEYERNRVKVEWVPLENLIGGYGSFGSSVGAAFSITGGIFNFFLGAESFLGRTIEKIPLPIGKFRTSIDFGITFCI